MDHKAAFLLEVKGQRWGKYGMCIIEIRLVGTDRRMVLKTEERSKLRKKLALRHKKTA